MFVIIITIVSIIKSSIAYSKTSRLKKRYGSENLLAPRSRPLLFNYYVVCLSAFLYLVVVM